MKQRLHKFIANAGHTSRRRAELLIQAGRVTVNGRVTTSLGTSIEDDRDEVRVNGEVVERPPPRSIVFHKPPGLITSTHDTHDRLTVMDWLPRSLVDAGVLPAGRLDQDTEGMLVLTNVGDLNHRITHPRYETEKEYVATLASEPPREALARLESGVRIEGERTAPARVLKVEESKGGVDVNIVIHEGRKRQVRRMFQAIGHEVLRLRRVRIGDLHLGDLPMGEWRDLDREDLARLVGEDAVDERWVTPPIGSSEGNVSDDARGASPSPPSPGGR